MNSTETLVKPAKEAEQSVIGAMMMNPEKAIPLAVEALNAEDFQYEPLREAFLACKSLYVRNRPIDPVTILGELGEEYKPILATACAVAPTAAHVGSYIEIVRDTAKRIRACEKAWELLRELGDGTELARVQDTASGICESLNETEAGGCYSAADLFARFYATKMTPKTYRKTGFPRLDRNTYIDRGDYIVVGARPSVGKTAFTLQMMLNMAKRYQVVYFSLETSSDKLMDRMIANYTGTPLGDVKTAKIKDWTRVAEAYDPFAKLKLHTVDAAGWTVPQIRAAAARLGAEVIFIDYLSLIKGEGKSLYERVTKISMDLHILAQQTGMTVIALSQLNRNGRSDPDMTDLRESGQIEQDADVILLLQDTKPEKENSDRKLIIAKNKEGATGAVTLKFQGEYQRFYEEEARYGDES